MAEKFVSSNGPDLVAERDQIQQGILSCVNNLWHIFASVVDIDKEAHRQSVEQFLEEKEKIHKFLIEIK